MQDNIKVFTSSSCDPCLEIKELINQGKFEFNGKVELIDVDTDYGFEIFDKEILGHSNSAVPSAYRNGQRCIIKIEDNSEDGQRVIFDCPE